MLNAQIRGVVNQLRKDFPAELNQLIEQGAGEISVMDIVERAIKVGEYAPDFSLTNRDGSTVSLSEKLQQGPVVLTFYRGIWCPFCNLQLAEYNKRLDEITATGASLVAITPEAPGGLDAFLNSDVPQSAKDTVIQSVEFDVLHDPKSAVAEKYGVVFTLPEAHQNLLKLMNLDIEKANGDDSFAFPDPATFIISQKGEIVWSYVPNNYRKRAEVDMLLSELAKL